MNPDDLVHVADWPRFVRYVREDRIHAETWRPGYLNVDVSTTLDAAHDLTDAQLGSWLRLVLLYASSPLLDRSAGPQSARRVTFATASRHLRVRGEHVSRTWEALNRAGLIEFSPGVLPDRQQQTREGQDLRPSSVRARESDAPTEDQDPGLGEGTAAAGSPASESEIRTLVASLKGHDRKSLHVVEPLANGVTRETFLELVDRAREARNPVGWLVERLRALNREERLDGGTVAVVQAPAPIERLSPEQALEANVRQLVDNGHAWAAIAEHVSAAFGEEHLATAEAIYTRASESA